MDEFKTVAQQAIQALQAANKRIESLQLASKTASVAVRPDGELIKQAVSCMKTAGLILDNETEEAQQLLSTDPNASIRLFTQFVKNASNAGHNSKQASIQAAAPVGHVVGGDVIQKEASKVSTYQLIIGILRGNAPPK